MPTTRKQKALRLMPEDIEIIDRLRRHYGIASDNEVIRMALRAADRELQQALAHSAQSGTPSGKEGK